MILRINLPVIMLLRVFGRSVPTIVSMLMGRQVRVQIFMQQYPVRQRSLSLDRILTARAIGELVSNVSPSTTQLSLLVMSQLSPAQFKMAHNTFIDIFDTKSECDIIELSEKRGYTVHEHLFKLNYLFTYDKDCCIIASCNL